MLHAGLDLSRKRLGYCLLDEVGERLEVGKVTLAAAALCHPVRRRTQRLADRRFKRGRYDAEATLAAFSGRLRDAVELDTIRDELLEAAGRTLEPTHACVWMRADASRS